MPLPTEPPISDAEAYNSVTQIARNVLASAERMKTAASGPILVSQVADLFDTLRGAKDDGQKLAAIAGIEAYAKTFNGDAYSITQSFMGVLAAGTAVTDWIIANVPGDGKGGIVTRRFQDGGKTLQVTMAPEEIAPITPLLDALIASISG